MRLTQLLEGLDSPYRWGSTFKSEEVMEEDEETGEEYPTDVLSPVQIVKFRTDEGVPYVWYARQNRYDDTTWEIAFGVHKGDGPGGEHQLDIGTTGSGNAFRVFATVIEITNHFIEFDEDGDEIGTLIIKSKGGNRTKLYTKRLIPRIDNFAIVETYPDGEETVIHLNRTR